MGAIPREGLIADLPFFLWLHVRTGVSESPGHTGRALESGTDFSHCAAPVC